MNTKSRRISLRLLAWNFSSCHLRIRLFRTLLRISIAWTIMVHNGALSAPRGSPEAIPEHTFRNTDCRVLINEVNFFTEHSSDKQYVELSRYCENDAKWSRGASMKGFLLVFIAPDGYILGICTLDSRLRDREQMYYVSQGPKRIKQVRKSWIYLIGSGVEDIDFKRESCDLVLAGDGKTSRFPIGVNYPVGLALVYNEKPAVLKNLKMTKVGNKFIRTQIDLKMEKTISKYLQDFYIYGSKTRFQYCEYFSKYYAYPSVTGTLLRDWHIPGVSDYSLSRCSGESLDTRVLPFKPDHFMYCDPSPGFPNICDKGIRFHIEDFQLKRETSDDVYMSSYTLPCHSYTEDPENINGIITSDVNFRLQLSEALQGALPGNFALISDTQSGGEDLNGACAVETVFVNSNTEFISEADMQSSVTGSFTANVIDQNQFEANLEAEKPYVWTDPDCKRFTEERRNEIKKIPGYPINIKDVLNPDVCYWFTYIPEANKYVCKLCKKLLFQNILFDRPKSLQLTEIMKSGVLNYHPKNRLNRNRDLINDHNSSVYHQISKQWFELYDSGLRSEELEDAFVNKPGAFYNYMISTRYMMAVTKQAVEMGLTFFNFSKLTDLLKYLGVDIGHLYANGNGVRAMIDSIGDILHAELLNLLVTNNHKFSILLDGTSDISSDSVIAVLFMHEDVNSVTKISLYKILHMTQGESGDQIFNKLKTELEKENIGEYFRKNLVSVTSDGGTNIFNVFNDKVNTYVGRTVLKHWCNNHRDNLIYVHTIRLFPKLQNVDTVVNKIHTMYNSRSPKNKAHLRAVTLEMGGKPFEVKRSHSIRWISGNLRAYKTILQKWEYIAEATQRIRRDKAFSASSKNTASNLLKDILDATFLSHLAFLCDIGDLFKRMSLVAEIKGATLISKKSMREEFLTSLRSLETVLTSSKTFIIQGSVDLNKPAGSQNVLSLKEFEENQVSFKGFALNSPQQTDKGYYLHENQKSYIDEFIKQTYFYYPEDPRDLFDIFAPQKLPKPSEYNEANVYGVDEITAMNAALNWGFETQKLVKSWKVLLSNVLSHAKFQNMTLQKPEIFWKYFMDPEINVGFEELTKGMMKNVLLVSASNAESERVLGIYARTKTRQRYLLNPTTVESILRIKINTDKNLKLFDTMKHAKSFILSGHSRSNDLSRRAKLLPKNEWDDLIAEDVTVDESTPCDEGEVSVDDDENEQQPANA